MANIIPEPPYNIPFTNKDGFVHPRWQVWLREAFVRMGGTTALTNLELEELPAEELAALDARVDATESDIADLQIVTASHTTSIAAIQSVLNDFGQGRSP